MRLTKDQSYFENWKIGDVVEHRRGRTFSQEENARWSLSTLNTAQAHWNVESMKTYFGGQFDRPLMNAALVVAVAIGLTSQDMSENAVRELGFDQLRIPSPCFPGDTVVATSTVIALDTDPSRQDAGVMTYRIALHNQNGEQVCELLRRVLLKKRVHWASLDEQFAIGTGA
jgi:itaconyl-CoA hydratase